jgi:hypothetical protein
MSDKKYSFNETWTAIYRNPEQISVSLGTKVRTRSLSFRTQCGLQQYTYPVALDPFHQQISAASKGARGYLPLPDRAFTTQCPQSYSAFITSPLTENVSPFAKLGTNN